MLATCHAVIHEDGRTLRRRGNHKRHRRLKKKPQISQMSADLAKEGGHSCPLQNLDRDHDRDRNPPGITSRQDRQETPRGINHMRRRRRPSPPLCLCASVPLASANSTFHHSITPSLHHSITPSLHHSITPSLSPLSSSAKSAVNPKKNFCVFCAFCGSLSIGITIWIYLSSLGVRGLSL